MICDLISSPSAAASDDKSALAADAAVECQGSVGAKPFRFALFSIYTDKCWEALMAAALDELARRRPADKSIDLLADASRHKRPE